MRTDEPRATKQKN